MPEGQIMLPLKLERAPVPLNVYPRPKVVQATWEMMEAKMRSVKNNTAPGYVSEAAINNAKQYYVAGVYAAAAAVLTERSHYEELSEAATEVENRY